MASNWYQDGLRFECTQCGDCGTGEPGYVWVSTREIEAIARHLEISVSEFRRRHVRKVKKRFSLVERANGDCIFYHDGCIIYPVRPSQCRSFPFWRENLARASDWEDAAVSCPGMNTGRLYSIQEIGRIRNGEVDASSLARGDEGDSRPQ